MNFNDVLNQKCEDYDIILGYNIDNSLLKVNIKESPTIVITGSTGTSKSILMHEIVLQLINKNSYNNLKIIPIALTRVELAPYANTKYSFCDVLNETSNISDMFDTVNNIIFARKRLFLKKEVKDFDEYNKKYNENMLNFILIVIDEATNILENKECVDKLFNIIDNCKDNGISVILNTNNVYNSFFKDNLNLNADCKISFDFVSSEDSTLNNIDNSHNLTNKNFIIKFKNKHNQSEFFPIEFDDKYIGEIINKQ